MKSLTIFSLWDTYMYNIALVWRQREMRTHCVSYQRKSPKGKQVKYLYPKSKPKSAYHKAFLWCNLRNPIHIGYCLVMLAYVHESCSLVCRIKDFLLPLDTPSDSLQFIGSRRWLHINTVEEYDVGKDRARQNLSTEHIVCKKNKMKR